MSQCRNALKSLEKDHLGIMKRDALTGSRIRERRIIAGHKQADLARQIGISASYLNLIEHNRRRIGGKLLLNIAEVLEVEVSALTEGAEAALIAALRDAAHGAHVPEAEFERAEEFASRFPGWAGALAASHRKIANLERTVATLSDRLAHDPELAASVHEVLSTAASIRSTASILAEDQDLTDEWRSRFHTNIDADSRRLAASSKILVGFLDAETGEAVSTNSPIEEVEQLVADHDYVFTPGTTPADLETLIGNAPQLTTVAARSLAYQVAERIINDNQRLKTTDLKSALADHGPDPVMLAQVMQAPVSLVMRRLAHVVENEIGLVVADRAGSILFRKAVSGFAVPRHGAACPLWPLFQVMGRPGQVLGQRVRMPGRSNALFDCYAVAEPYGPIVLNTIPLVEATMLIVPIPMSEIAADQDVIDVGSSCRICPQRGCAGRREPSILSEGF